MLPPRLTHTTRAITGQPWRCSAEIRAHGGEVTDIAVQSTNHTCLVATSGRDRMVQLFKSVGGSLELIQTMDEHVGAVGRLLFMNDGEKLLSCSADRTVIVRERATREVDGVTTTAAFLLSKVLTLKASIVSMTPPRDDPDALVVSTIDRYIHRFDIPSGRQVHSFRATDPETSETVVMSSLTVERETPGQNPRLLVGVSTTDKSIRVYDLDKDTLLTREFGHTEGVSDVLLLDSGGQNTGEEKKTLVSTGLDGVVMIWDLSVQQQIQDSPQPSIRAEDATPVKELTATKPPLRRILSKSELVGFQKSDSPTSSPTPVREPSPPRIRHKTSRYTLNSPVPRNGGTPPTVCTPPLPPPRRSPTSALSDGRFPRSPSPPSPKSSKELHPKRSNQSLRRPTLDFRCRSRTNGSSPSNEFGSINMSTEQVCRTLRAYRKKLNGSSDHLHTTSELEKELDLTVQALGERTKKPRANGDTPGNNHNSNNNRSNKLNDNLNDNTPSSVKQMLITRRVPSTPNLRHSTHMKLRRKHSLDADSGK